MKKVLAIAGSDSSGGAGIQADIKTITSHNQYAMSVITALTAQNTKGVFAIQESSPDFVKAQLDVVFIDIFPDAVKIGMVSSAEIIKVIAERLRYYKPSFVVVDPVMISTSGSRLISETAKAALKNDLFPLSALITPNIPEAEVLCGFAIKDFSDMQKATIEIFNRFKCNVLVKGGHLSSPDTTDLLLENGELRIFQGKRVNNNNTHGTGCTLSSAIACGLATGKSLSESVQSAKEYVSGALEFGLNLGNGAGPINHMWKL